MSKTNRQRDKEKRGQTIRTGCSQKAAVKGEIDWKGWWPFTRATGAALRQLNKPEPCEDALM